MFGVRSPGGDVVTFTADQTIESWRRGRVSQHTKLEVAAAHRRGRPLKPGSAVPGCRCTVCATYQAGGSAEDAELAETIVERLAQLDWSERFHAANIWRGGFLATGATLPPARTLVRQADRDAGDHRVTKTFAPLPIEDARRASILDLCQRLGIELRRVGRSYRGRCPVHGGDGPNFSVDPDRGLFKCFVCDEGGDGIRLWELVRGVSFPTAIREILSIEGGVING